MTISFILNGEDMIHTAESHQSLLSVMQQHFTLAQSHAPCEKTYCQRCLILLDNKLMLACRVPFFMVRRKEVITLEGWKLTEEYRLLKNHMEKSSVVFCPSCTDLRLFTYHSCGEALAIGEPWELQRLMSDIPCRCGTMEEVTQALETYGDKRGGNHVGKK